ncbi:MAG: LysM peptidoglycan-binding domain-containing protein [Spirochaetota bacterium]|nr:LysM peptidoglycan-binding domain-containing protein [Spirochaetota bacterium]
MKSARKTAASIVTIVVAALSFGCGDPIPVREMSLARMEITRAESVRADKYAPAELGEARKLLLGTHELIKGDELEKAKQGALDSFAKAREAYEKSLPLLARDTMEIAEKSLGEADEANADMLARDEFEKAQAAFKTAGDSFESKKYYEAYQAALEADKLAKSARNSALGKRAVLKEAIAEVDSVIAEAVKLNARTHSPEKLNTAEESNRAAAEALDGLQLKKGFAAVAVAKTNADEAYLDALKGSSADDLAAATAAVDKAGKSKGAAFAKDELSASRESLARAREAHDDGRYRESMALSAEAKRLAASVAGARKAGKLAAGGEKDAEEAGDGEFKTYRVKYNPSRRDCLWRIAERQYGNPRLWTRIYEANRDTIKNPNLIRPGQAIKIPVLTPVKGKPKSSEDKLIEQSAIRMEAAPDEDAPKDDPGVDEDPSGDQPGEVVPPDDTGDEVPLEE